MFANLCPVIVDVVAVTAVSVPTFTDTSIPLHASATKVFEVPAVQLTPFPKLIEFKYAAYSPSFSMTTQVA